MPGLQLLQDMQKIEDIYYIYAHLLDTQQADKVALSCFTEDVVTYYGSGEIDRGRDALIRRFETYPDNLEATSHNITNIVVRVDGDEATASARAIGAHWLLANRHLGPDRPVDFLMIAAYADTFRRTVDGWRISERTLHGISPGGLSLAYGVPWPASFPHLREAGWPG